VKKSPYLESVRRGCHFELAGLLAGRQPGFSLPQEFYTDSELFRLDRERVFRRRWLFAGYTLFLSQSAERGCTSEKRLFRPSAIVGCARMASRKPV